MISINEIIVKALSISPGRTHGSAERVIKLVAVERPIMEYEVLIR